MRGVSGSLKAELTGTWAANKIGLEEQMTRRSKNRRPPETGYSDHSGPRAPGAVDRLAPGSAPRDRRPYSVPAVCGLLLLAVIAVFGQTANHAFVNFDDNFYIYENPHVREGLTGEGIAWAITAFTPATGTR